MVTLRKKFKRFLERSFAIFPLVFVSAISAQSLDRAEIDATNLEAIDRLISDIERQISLVEASIGKGTKSRISDDVERASEEESSDQEEIKLVTKRLPTNPLCLADSEYGLSSMENVEAYFAINDELLQKVSGDRAAFVTLLDNAESGSCDHVAELLLERMTQTIVQIDRNQLVDVAFHLEGCWPDSLDEKIVSTDQFDAFYRIARTQRGELAKSQRSLKEASESCR